MTEPTSADLEDLIEVTSDNEKFVQIPLWVLWNPDLSPASVRMYGTLQAYASGNTGAVWPSIQTLASHTGISTKTVTRQIDELRSIGAVTRKRRRSGDRTKTSNIYVVHWRPTFKTVQDDYTPDTTAARAKVASNRAEAAEAAEQPTLVDEPPKETKSRKRAEQYPGITTDPEENAAQLAALNSRTHPEVEELLTHLADLIEANGTPRPRFDGADRAYMLALMDNRGQTPAQIRAVIDWSQQDPHWRALVLSMVQFHGKYDTLRLRTQAAIREKKSSGPGRRPANRPTTSDRVATGVALYEKYAAMDAQNTQTTNLFQITQGDNQ